MRSISNKSGFSVVVAILVSAFLIVISMGVLDLIIGERRITRTVYNTVSTYAGAEGALELALLGIANHREGYENGLDIAQKNDKNVNMLAQNPDSPIENKEQKIGYSMETRAKSFSGTAKKEEFVIIPLFYDPGTKINKEPTITMEPTKQLFADVTNNPAVVWNIIGNDDNGNTYGITGTGNVVHSMRTKIRKLTNATGNEISYDTSISVGDFIGNTYKDCYLVLYSDSYFSYDIRAENGFSLPKISALASSQIGSFKQNIMFTEDKSRIFDALKYSIFGGR